ncbi:ferredoxin [Aldersonia kunmingensis]|uniref:ferredoxin n=1 Tax=Aldersonia kunmingensis TaxID=408066 RepID=UPI00082987FA|nr:ferredoxin [Aldersonia kunmingensis]
MQPKTTKHTTRQLRVDPHLCEAHALCTELAPDIFDLGDDIATCEPDVDQTHWDSVEAAISACPRQAIGWVSD